MAALFPRWTNTVARLAVGVLLGTPAVGAAALMVYVRTPFATGEGESVEQPVQFDHRHHAGEEGIDCRFCHRTAERSPYAGVPAVTVCMGCHGQIWNQSELLEPVRQAFFQRRPIAWKRVHNLPDFVYFDHSIHLAKGVGCASCHGRVDQMASVRQAVSLSMAWCLDCHRDPTPHLRPLDRVADMAWVPQGAEQGRRLAEELDVHPRTSCTACHR